VAKAYRELEHGGVIELRHGAGAFVSASAKGRKLTDKSAHGPACCRGGVEKLRAKGLSDEEIAGSSSGARGTHESGTHD